MLWVVSWALVAMIGFAGGVFEFGADDLPMTFTAKRYRDIGGGSGHVGSKNASVVVPQDRGVPRSQLAAVFPDRFFSPTRPLQLRENK